MMKRLFFILSFFVISNGLYSQVFWDELLEADTSNYFLVSGTEGVFDTIHLDDLVTLISANGLGIDSFNLNAALDTLRLFTSGGIFQVAIDGDAENELPTLQTGAFASDGDKIGDFWINAEGDLFIWDGDIWESASDDNDPTNELYDDTDINNRVDSTSNAILWEDLGTYIADKETNNVQISDDGNLGIGGLDGSTAFFVNTSEIYPFIFQHNGSNRTYLNSSGDQTWNFSTGGQVRVNDISGHGGFSFWDSAITDEFQIINQGTNFRMGYESGGSDGFQIYPDEGVYLANYLQINNTDQGNAVNILGRTSTDVVTNVDLTTDLEISDGELGFKNDGFIYRTYHQNERPTLHPLWADLENDWFLANERFESTTNTCGLNDAALYNISDNYGNVIIDSCTFSLIFCNNCNGRTYADGYLVFVPYAYQPIEPTDSIKVRVRDRFNDWYDVYYGLFNLEGNGLSNTYGWVYCNAPLAYIREFEITFYGSVEISEIEYYYDRDGGLTVPTFYRHNYFYRDNYFLQGLGDQYLSLGTSGQILSSDGAATEWIDPYVWDSVHIYNYIDASDYWNQSNDTLFNESDWNVLQLDGYGTGLQNNKGVEFTMFDSDGNLQGWSVDSVDISNTNEERVYDTYIENGFNTRRDNFNFSDFIEHHEFYSGNTNYSTTNDIDDLSAKQLINYGSARDIIMTDSFVLMNTDAGREFRLYTWDGFDVNSIVLDTVMDYGTFYDFSFAKDNKYIYTIYAYPNAAGGIIGRYSIDSFFTGGNALIDVPYDFNQPMYYLDISADYNYWLAGSFHSSTDSIIVKYQFNSEADFANSTPLDTIHLNTWANFPESGSISFLTNDLIIATNSSVDSFWVRNWNNELINSGVLSYPEVIRTTYYNGFLYGYDNIGTQSFLLLGEVKTDTLYTDLYEKLDTSNYYSYSVDIEGNGTDNVRTGIATWLDGNKTIEWTTTADTLYTGWYRHEIDFRATEHDSIKPIFVLTSFTKIKNVRLFLKQFEGEANTDNQTIDTLQLNGTTLEISLENDGQVLKTVDLSSLKDGYEANTDDQVIDVFGFDGTNLTLSLESDGEATKSLDLSSLSDGTGTDDQIFDVATFSGGTLSLSLEDDGQATKTFDFDARYLQSEVDGSTTNEGLLTLSEVLTGYAWLLTSNTSGSDGLGIAEQTAVAATNRIIDITQNGYYLNFNLRVASEIEDLTTFSGGFDEMLVWDYTDSDWKTAELEDLAAYFADGTGTDDQTLSVASTTSGTISIESGNTIDLTELIFDQVATFLSGNTETNITVTPQDVDNTIDFVVTGATDDQNLTFGIQVGNDVPLEVEGATAAAPELRAGSNVTFNRISSTLLEISATGDGTGTDDQKQSVNTIGGVYLGNESQSGSGVEIIGGTGISVSGVSGTSGSITITNIGSGESTTVNTGFDLIGTQINASFDEFTTDAALEGDEFIILYDNSSGHEKVDVDVLAAYVADGTGTDDQQLGGFDSTGEEAWITLENGGLVRLQGNDGITVNWDGSEFDFGLSGVGNDGNGLFDSANNGGTIPATFTANITTSLNFSGGLYINENGGDEYVSINGGSRYNNSQLNVTGDFYTSGVGRIQGDFYGGAGSLYANASSDYVTISGSQLNGAKFTVNGTSSFSTDVRAYDDIYIDDFLYVNNGGLGDSKIFIAGDDGDNAENSIYSTSTLKSYQGETKWAETGGAYGYLYENSTTTSEVTMSVSGANQYGVIEQHPTITSQFIYDNNSGGGYVRVVFSGYIEKTDPNEDNAVVKVFIRRSGSEVRSEQIDMTAGETKKWFMIQDVFVMQDGQYIDFATQETTAFTAGTGIVHGDFYIEYIDEY